MLMVIKYCCRVYRTTSKYCRIIARKIMKNTISPMITSDPYSQMFWCSTSAWYSCFRDYSIAPKTSDSLRSPIHIFVQVIFLSPPQIELVPWCLTELELPLPGVTGGGNSMQIHPNTCNRIVYFHLTPKLMGEKGKEASNIGKQSQYLTDDHPGAACFSTLAYKDRKSVV